MKKLTPERSAHYHSLAMEFIAANIPPWLMHPKVLRALRVKTIKMRNDIPARGMADHDGTLWLCPLLTTKFRSASTYSAPFGKSDMSPMGVLVHEMGHLVEFGLRAKGIRYQEEWWNIAVNFKRHAITSYAKSHPMEDFAESFRLWALDPKRLKELSFERHAFMTKYVTQLLGGKRSAFRFTRRDAKDNLADLYNFTKADQAALP